MIESDLLEISGVLLISMVIAGLCRDRGWSAAIPLLGAGITIGLLPLGPSSPSSPEFVLVVILAPLVFGESLTSSIVDLRRVGRPVLAMATGLVVFGAFCVGVVAHYLVAEFWWSIAFALGAVLAPTDAVAVSTTAKRAGLPRRLVNILEGESLVNDGTALTLLRVCSAVAAAGSVAPGDAVLILGASVVGGCLVGALGGFLLLWVLRRSRDTTVTNGMILIAPFPIYTAAEWVRGSGILAVVIAGLVVAHGAANETQYTGRLQSASVWRTVNFVLASVASFIVGLEMPHTLAELDSRETGLLFVVVPAVLLTLILSRTVFVYAMTHFIRSSRAPGNSWVIAAWAGTRGPISALAAFTLPEATDAGAPIPGRNLAISVTFCVVLASLLLAPTIAPLSRKLDLPRENDRALLRRSRLAMARAALERLDEIESSADRREVELPADALAHLRATAESRLEQATVRAASGDETVPLHLKAMRRISMEMTHAEQEELLRLRDEQGLPDDLMRELQQETDQRARALGSLG